jgi:type I restriction enzyme S subunit
MNAERLLVHYEQIADAPDAIGRLRRFILDMAVRGKLVPQDPNDEPAAELKSRFAATLSTDKGKSGGRGKRPVIAAGLIEEPPYEVPLNWIWARMGALGDTNVGLTYSPADVGDSGYPVLRSNNIQDGKIDLSGLVRVRTRPKDSAMVQKGDILICARNGSRALVGKAALIEELPEPMAFGAFMSVFRSPINKYLHLFILSPLFREVIDEVNTTTINQITQANLLSTLVPLPPLAEQVRIVAKVDEMMGLCDGLEATRGSRERMRDRLTAASLARLNAPDPKTFQADARFALDALPALTTRPDQIKQLRQTILNLAVRGRLVPPDVNDEPAPEWLLRTFGNRTAESGKKSKTLVAPLEDVSAGYSMPDSWVWMQLGRLVTVIDAGWSPQCENHPRSDPNKWGVLKTTAVQTLAFDFMQHKELPTKFKPRPQHEAQVGDILVTRAGPKNRVGVSCVVDRTEPRLMISDKLIRFRLIEGLSPRFIALTLNAGVTNAAIEEAKSGMAVMQMNISQDKLRAVPVPLPPLAEQYRIVGKVDALMALCDRLEASLAATAATRRRLLDALLAEALAPVDDRELEAAE